MTVESSASGNAVRHRIGNRSFHHSIPERHRLPRDGRHALSGNENSHKIQRVGCRDRNDIVCKRNLAHGAHGIDGDRQRELFAEEAVDEAAAADLTAVLEAAEGHQQFALPEAVDALRSVRRRRDGGVVVVAAADPLNLAGIVTAGSRISPFSGQVIAYRDGVPIEIGELGTVRSKLQHA